MLGNLIRKQKQKLLDNTFLLGRMPACFLIVGCLLAQSESFQHHGKSPHHKFDDVNRWAEAFEKPERDSWQKPDEVIKTIGLGPNSSIADIGSATGYFPVRFARVATQGNVYGIDIEKNMVDYLNNRAVQEGLTNLTSIKGEPDDPKIPEKVDIVFICNTYHHIEERTHYFSNLKRYLVAEGSLIIVDFKKGDLPIGPRDHMKISKEDVVQEITAAGYRFVSSPSVLPYQYFLIFEATNN
jgi:ubiquinone/menaquinone biosynthesis C-methylase UbiE